MQTISRMLEGTAHYEPERIAVIFGDHRITYRDLDRGVNRMANGFIELGLSPGDRAMLFMKNSPILVTTYFALLRAGLTVVPLNVMNRRHEIVHIGLDTAAAAIIADEDLWLDVALVKDDLPELKRIIINGPGKIDGTVKLADVAAHSDANPQVDVGLDGIASIIYTSGTTGRAKGATQTHRSIYYNVLGCFTRNKFCRDDLLLCALPLFNNFAINVVMMSSFFTGAAMVVIKRFDARKVIDNISKYKCTYFAGTPTMFSYLLQEYDRSKDHIESLRVTSSGGAHCPWSLIRQIEDTFGTVHLDGYGQTEGCGFTTLNPLVGVRKENSVGIPISNVRLKIVSSDGKELPHGEVGEIVEKGDVFSVHGYWNRPEVNEEVYKGGWFHSGDLGYVDKDGYLFVVDRKQDLIITGGANIYPAEVEEVLYSHHKVAIAAVIGIPDDVKGELAKAYIVLKKGETATEKEIIDFVRDRIAKYKAPRMVEFVESLPQGPTGKILKRVLRDKVN
jgi:long-chain acyl-CoA synthetase